MTVFCPLQDSNGWTIHSGVPTDYSWGYSYSETPIYFSRQRDCQAACDALNARNLTEEDVYNLSDKEFRDIILERLQW